MKRNSKIFSIVSLFVLGIVVLGACRKKERLTTGNSFSFEITPPTVVVAKDQTQTFTARIVAPSGAQSSVNPSWAVTPSTMDFLSTHIGASVSFTPTALGDVVIVATYDGMEARAHVSIAAYKPGGNSFDVYTDVLPTGSGFTADIFTSGGLDIAVSESGYCPQGTKYQHITNAASASFWGITLDKNSSGQFGNFSDLIGGDLRFSIRLGRALIGAETILINVEGTVGGTVTVDLTNIASFSKSSTEWQDVSIPLSNYLPAVDASQIKVPYALVTNPLRSPLTYDVDAIRWQK